MAKVPLPVSYYRRFFSAFYLTPRLTAEAAVTHGTSGMQHGRAVSIKEQAHGGLRTKLFGPKDYEIDEHLGGVVKGILDVVGNNPVYLWIDIDVLDPRLVLRNPEVGPRASSNDTSMGSAA
ncbi:hypothetical protein P175DRAFT_0534780 [Aspergillus ochraceoroseus IBT 24754]|uniref:Uncharacterized protein n=1 Tax=Aspergillus ochraceoroseus IBT 24754 TaxID=1392256 RepID=A0A2T5LRT4_9EURO|nr:uncharacterized protein P175DRAFT_0534780 [Aspergillus ochraceoroseus IBT 24754]PTU18994.1 hypothetical protein P175DRAFT_0534780 [Aspergillus ochraceoroseus IBT 24754]